MLIDELRRINSECAAAFLNAQPERRGDEWPKLFAPGAQVEYAIAHGEILTGEAREDARSWLNGAGADFARSAMHGTIQFEGDNPNLVLVKTTMSGPAGRAWYYFELLLGEGKIRRLRIVADPSEQLHDPASVQ